MFTIDLSVVVIATMIIPVILLGVCILAAICDIRNLSKEIRKTRKTAKK